MYLGGYRSSIFWLSKKNRNQNKDFPKLALLSQEPKLCTLASTQTVIVRWNICCARWCKECMKFQINCSNQHEHIYSTLFLKNMVSPLDSIPLATWIYNWQSDPSTRTTSLFVLSAVPILTTVPRWEHTQWKWDAYICCLLSWLHPFPWQQFDEMCRSCEKLTECIGRSNTI